MARIKRLLRPPATAVVVAVSEAAEAAASLPDTGMPPHVTVLWPFARRLRSKHRRGLEALARQRQPFEFVLGEIREFPGGVTYLAPEPAHEFVALTAAVVARWPRMKPYGGAFADVIPHVTVQTGEPLDAASRDTIEAMLPIASTARELVVLAPRGERWETVYRVSLGQPANPS